jgi:phosphoribosylformylglycinamidine synthase
VACRPGQVLRIPIAHGEGNYFAPPEIIDRLERQRQVVFRYCSPAGDVSAEANPNGSIHGIAGLCNERRNVVGLMPHPERACEPALGSTDGRLLFESVIRSLKTGTFSPRESIAWSQR